MLPMSITPKRVVPTKTSGIEATSRLGARQFGYQAALAMATTRQANARDQQRTQGSTSLGDVVLVRELDKSSTKLAEACANGTFFPEVQVDLCATVGNKQEPYLTYKMKNCIVTSYSFS